MVGLIAALWLGATAPVTSSPPPAEQARFKALVLEGERQFGEGEYGAAIWNFKEADALRVTPEVAFNLAKAHEKLGDVPMASYYYRLYLRRAPDATDALEVAEILGKMLSNMEGDGQGLVEIDSPTQGTLTLQGDTWVSFPVALFLPPGEYEATATLQSGRLTQVIAVRTGKTTSTVFDPVTPPLLDADGSNAAFAFGTSKAGSSQAVLRVSSVAVMGVSAAALAVGTALGVMSRTEAGRLTANKSSLTVTEANGVARSAGSKGLAANILWAAGGAGLVGGGALFVFTLPEPGVDTAARGGGR